MKLRLSVYVLSMILVSYSEFKKIGIISYMCMDITQLNHSILNLARLNCRRFHCCCWELHWRLLAALVKIIRSLGDFILQIRHLHQGLEDL
jgi:hypothetical protein